MKKVLEATTPLLFKGANILDAFSASFSNQHYPIANLEHRYAISIAIIAKGYSRLAIGDYRRLLIGDFPTKMRQVY